jgi:hypothetical protein
MGELSTRKDGRLTETASLLHHETGAALDPGRDGGRAGFVVRRLPTLRAQGPRRPNHKTKQRRRRLESFLMREVVR